MYADGLGVVIDTDKAQEYYALALDGFETLEMQKPWKYLEYRIGKMYSQGLGMEQDYELAAQWFKKSAEQKYKFAEYSLGGLYHRGQGVELSYEKAFELYLRSANQGFPYADFEVAKMFRDAIGTKKDEKQSNHHFEKAFIGFKKLEQQSHDDKIQYRLGWMLQNGIGTKKDIVRAKEYFEKSAKLGNTFLECCENNEQRSFYLDLAKENNLSKLALMKAIKEEIFEQALTVETPIETESNCCPVVANLCNNEDNNTAEHTKNDCRAFVTRCELFCQGIGVSKMANKALRYIRRIKIDLCYLKVIWYEKSSLSIRSPIERLGQKLKYYPPLLCLVEQNQIPISLLS
ncbi:MAG: tetratricopeptide repeat protein [Angelakisella sp.]